MSEPNSTHRLSSKRRAARNPYSQADANASLARYLAHNNLPVPDTLNRPVERRLCLKKRQRYEEHESNVESDVHRSEHIEDHLPQTFDLPDHHVPTPPHQQDSPEVMPTGQRSHEDDTVPGLNSPIGDVKKTAQFIDSLLGATLEQSNMQPEDIERLRAADGDPRLDVMDKHFAKSLRIFLLLKNSSQAAYDGVRTTLAGCYPDDPVLSFWQTKKRVEQLSGVVPIFHDMCPNTCAGFTGPFADYDHCPICGKDRYRPDTREPQRQFVTIPLGPVIQALYGSPETADNMHYRERTTAEILEYARTHGGKLREYNDTTCGRDYLDAVETGKINKDDVVVQFSLDGAQLYRDKDSDCWIFIYIIHNLPPEIRYKKKLVIPAGFVPGPQKMKDGDSFIYPVLYHISALQNEGLRIWDASTQSHIPRSIPFVFVTADSPAMAMVSGMVGHRGKFGCRLYCALPGRRRARDGHYYPAMLKPDAYDVTGCNHEDVTFSDLKRYQQGASMRYHDNLHRLVSADNLTQFKDRRLETGLCKQTIFSGLRYSLGIPNIFPLDIMHLVNLNDPDLLLGLWRGTAKVYPPDETDNWNWRVLVDTVWEAHGKTVVLATQFIPSCFGRAPRNPAEKINSGYKAWEYQLYLIGLGPALFRYILPREYWLNYCKYVSSIRILQKWAIAPDELQRAHRLLCKFTHEFEQLYCQRRPDRIHFVRQSIHLLTHMASETVRIGPLSCFSQWTIETAIGNLGEEIHQDRDPYANIAQRGILRAQLNSTVAMYPHLDTEAKDGLLPRGAKDLGDGYALLRACQTTAEPVIEAEANAILRYWEEKNWPNLDGWPRVVKRWSRLQLPNGQKARSRWYESQSTVPLRKMTCVKVEVKGTTAIAEVEYFFRLQFGDVTHSLALVSLFSPPDLDVLESSHRAAYICHHGGIDALTVVNVKAIREVVSMVPNYQVTSEGEIVIPEGRFSLVEAPFLRLASLYGTLNENDDGIDNGNNTVQ